MNAGFPYEINLEMYWAPEDLLPHDYSVVIWAEKSKVSMTVDHDHESENFPNYKLSSDVTLIGLDGEPIIDGSGSGQDETVDDGFDLPNIVRNANETFTQEF